MSFFMTKIEFDIPIRTVSEANCSENRFRKNKRHKGQQLFVKMSLGIFVKECSFPCEITLTRMSPRLFDDDNVVSSFKYVRDEISEYIAKLNMSDEERKKIKDFYVTKKGVVRRMKGRFDNDPRMTWVYCQEKYFRDSVRICIEF